MVAKCDDQQKQIENRQKKMLTGDGIRIGSGSEEGAGAGAGMGAGASRLKAKG